MAKINKTSYERREELREALTMIDGAVQRYKETKQPGELGTIAVYLRGLLFGTKPEESLLLSLAEEEGTKLEVYTYEPPYLSEQIAVGLRDGLVYSFSGDCVSLTCEKPLTKKVSVQEWLAIPVIQINGARFTPRNLINEVANTMGPAHFSSKKSAHMADLKRIRIFGMPSEFRSVFVFAEILVVLGKRFLEIP